MIDSKSDRNYCHLCDRRIAIEFYNNHLMSLSPNYFTNSIIRRFIIRNPNPNKNDILLRKFIINHSKQIIIIHSILNLKLLMPSNRIKNIKNPCYGISHIDRINEQRFFSKIIEKGDNPQLLKLSITFFSSFETIKYEHQLKQPMQSIEMKLNQFL